VIKMRIWKLLSFLAIAVASASAIARDGGGSIDPFYIQNPEQFYYACNGSWQCNAPYRDTTGKTQRNTPINTGVRNLVLLVMGQSNNENEAPSAYTPTNGSAIDEFNIYDGSIYAASDPHLGASYNNTGPGLMDFRVADSLITSGKFDRVILVPMALGGSNIAMWANGGPLQNLPCVAMKRLAARGIAPGTNVTFAADWGQGEAEVGLGTSQAAYTASFNQIKTNLVNCGFSGRIFVNVETLNGTTSAAVQAAQAAVVDNVTVFAGANLDTMNNTTTFRVDGVHFNDNGSSNGASLKVTAWHASGAPF
jgi:hypothetical protein